MMAGRRLQALCLVLVMLSSTVAAPASAQTTDPKQPSVENPHMHFWGTSQMDHCWTHFDRNGSDGSSQDGYGEKEFLYHHSEGYWEALEKGTGKAYRAVYKMEDEPVSPQAVAPHSSSLLVFGKSALQVCLLYTSPSPRDS